MTVDQQISTMDDTITMPRQNGELVFEAPWEARAFGLAVALSEYELYPWRDFSQGLAEKIAEDEESGVESTYYERWLAALERLVLDKGFATHEELDAMITQQALHDDHHDHEHPHNEHHHPH